MSKKSHIEGLKVARLLMVLSSISPLFILWAIRGSSLISDRYFLTFCALMVIIPNAFLWLRIMIAKKLQERRELIVGTSEDHREHLLVYLFAMLLPFYMENLDYINIERSIELSRKNQGIINQKFLIQRNYFPGIRMISNRTTDPKIFLTGGMLMAGLGFEGEIISGVNAASLILRNERGINES